MFVSGDRSNICMCTVVGDKNCVCTIVEDKNCVCTVVGDKNYNVCTVFGDKIYNLFVLLLQTRTIICICLEITSIR